MGLKQTGMDLIWPVSAKKVAVARGKIARVLPEARHPESYQRQDIQLMAGPCNRLCSLCLGHYSFAVSVMVYADAAMIPVDTPFDPCPQFESRQKGHTHDRGNSCRA